MNFLLYLGDKELNTDVHILVVIPSHKCPHKSEVLSKGQIQGQSFFRKNKYICMEFLIRNRSIGILDSPIGKFVFGLFWLNLVEVLTLNQDHCLAPNHVFAEKWGKIVKWKYLRENSIS